MKTSNELERVVFYLKIEDKELLYNHSALLKISNSFFVRNTILKELSKPTIQVRKRNLDTSNYIKSLMAIGNNLNQIARKLNSGYQFSLIDQQQLLDEIEKIIDHIQEIHSKL